MSTETIQHAGILWNIEYAYTPMKQGGPGDLYRPEKIELKKVCAEGSSANLLECLSPTTQEGLEDEISCVQACARKLSSGGLQDAYEKTGAWDHKDRL